LNLLSLQLKESKGYMKLRQQSAMSRQHAARRGSPSACWKERREGQFHAGYVLAPQFNSKDTITEAEIDFCPTAMEGPLLHAPDFVGVVESGIGEGFGFQHPPNRLRVTELAGHGPTLFAGLSKRIDLKLVSRAGVRFGSGGDAV
jgi:hypothetical protein